MLTTVWLMLGTLLHSLQLNTGFFPKLLSEEEDRYYLKRSQTGDLEARKILIERDLRLVAHIMNNPVLEEKVTGQAMPTGTHSAQSAC